MKKFFESFTVQMKGQMKDKLKSIAAGQGVMKDDLKRAIAAGHEEVKSEIKREASQMIELLDEKLLAVEDKIDPIEVKVHEIENNSWKEITDIIEEITGIEEEFFEVKGKIINLEESIDQKVDDELGQLKKNFKTEIEENFDKRIKNLEKQLVKLLVTEKTRNCFLLSRDKIKLSTFAGKSSWEFSTVTEANGWNINA